MSWPNGGHGRDRDDAAPKFDHLLQLTDRRGTFEHARHAEPSPDVGYRTDDVARVLVVPAREPGPIRR